MLLQSNLLVSLLAASATVHAGSSSCTQASAEGSNPPSRTNVFNSPRIMPFYQFLNNWGYCAEVSLIQSAMANGAWFNQVNSRALTTTFNSYPQIGGSSSSSANWMAQMLLDDSSRPGCTGCNSWGDAATRAKLNRVSFSSSSQSTGSAGIQQFLTWVKKEVLAGHVVTMGVSMSDSNSLEHIVTVLGIGSNYPASDTTYRSDDVIYFDDHGVFTFSGSSYGSDSDTNPSIPPGAGTDTRCTPYKFGYTFASFANKIGSSSRKYRLPYPGSASDSKSFAYSVRGIVDSGNKTLPVSLRITSNGGFPRDQYAGYNYESPMIGSSVYGNSVTNTIPTAPTMTFAVEVRNLTPGTQYNLYLYKSTSVRSAFDAVPTSNFNANAAKATSKTTFTASSSTYSTSITIPSSTTIIYRCVPVSAP